MPAGPRRQAARNVAELPRVTTNRRRDDAATSPRLDCGPPGRVPRARSPWPFSRAPGGRDWPSQRPSRAHSRCRVPRSPNRPTGRRSRNTAAQALFDQARDEMKDGHFAEACPKLEEAIRLEPSGAGAKLKLAECYEGAGRLASAFATYVVAETAARAAGRTDRASWAAERAAALKPRLSTLTLSVAESAKGQEGLSLRRDGREIGRAEWGSACRSTAARWWSWPKRPGTSLARGRSTCAASDAATVVIRAARGGARRSAPAPEPTRRRSVAAPPPRPSPRARTHRGRAARPDLGLGDRRRRPGQRHSSASDSRGRSRRRGRPGRRVRPARERCPRGYDVDGTNSRKLLDFGMFVGLGSAGAAALRIALVGAAVGLSEDEPGEKRQRGRSRSRRRRAGSACRSPGRSVSGSPGPRLGSSALVGCPDRSGLPDRSCELRAARRARAAAPSEQGPGGGGAFGARRRERAVASTRRRRVARTHRGPGRAARERWRARSGRGLRGRRLGRAPRTSGARSPMQRDEHVRPQIAADGRRGWLRCFGTDASVARST
jgi:hypothetical protein